MKKFAYVILLFNYISSFSNINHNFSVLFQIDKYNFGGDLDFSWKNKYISSYGFLIGKTCQVSDEVFLFFNVNCNYNKITELKKIKFNPQFGIRIPKYYLQIMIERYENTININASFYYKYKFIHLSTGINFSNIYNKQIQNGIINPQHNLMPFNHTNERMTPQLNRVLFHESSPVPFNHTNERMTPPQLNRVLFP